jgi:hypothetical protein
LTGKFRPALEALTNDFLFHLLFGKSFVGKCRWSGRPWAAYRNGRSVWLVFALPTCHHQRPPVGGSSRNESLARDDRCKGEWRLAERATGRRACAAPSALIFLINRSTVDDECCYLRLSVFFPAAKTTRRQDDTTVDTRLSPIHWACLCPARRPAFAALFQTPGG